MTDKLKQLEELCEKSPLTFGDVRELTGNELSALLALVKEQHKALRYCSVHPLQISPQSQAQFAIAQDAVNAFEKWRTG